MRRNLWFLLLCMLFVGCATTPEGETEEEVPGWPDVIENAGLPQSAFEMLESIENMPGASASLSDAAKHRKTHPFEGCIERVSWARVLVAYRYAEAGEKATSASDRDKYYALAENVLEDADPEDPEDPAWANDPHGPAHSALQYLTFIKDKVVLPPQEGGCSDPSLRDGIVHLCDELLSKHAKDDPDDTTVELGDPVAWARVVCAYYAGEYANNWAITKDELDHIDD